MNAIKSIIKTGTATHTCIGEPLKLIEWQPYADGNTFFAVVVSRRIWASGTREEMEVFFEQATRQ